MSILKKYWFVIYLLSNIIILLLINNWFWPTPDEYYYATISKLIASSVMGKFCLSCFNTEHTFLVSAVVGLINLVRGNLLDILDLRIPVILFSLGTIILFYKIAKEIFSEHEDQLWFLLLLFLIPGFYLFSVRLMLDAPLLFGYSLVSYFLIKRKSGILVGLCLLIILLIKEYGFFLSLPFIIVFRIIDNIKWGFKDKLILRIISDICLMLIPSMVVMYVLLFKNWMPYPRLLETQMIEYSSGLYNIASSYSKAGLPSLNGAVSFVVKSSSYAFKNIKFSSINTPYKDTLINRLWLIYKYNFSSQDLSVLILPMFLSGWLISIWNLIKCRFNNPNNRIDLYFFLYTLVFFFLNWHEALNVHGFRLTVPLLLPLLYYATVCLKGLFDRNVLCKWLYSFMLLGSVTLYWFYIKSLGKYQSILAKNGVIETLLNYKSYIFTLVFVIVYLVLTSQRTKFLFINKKVAIGGIFLFLLFISLLPSFLDSKLSVSYYGYDYGMIEASKILSEIRKTNQPIGTNIHIYEMNYYSENNFLNTLGSVPLNRSLPNERVLYTRYPESEEYGVKDNLPYFFYLNKETTANSTSVLFKSLSYNYCVAKKEVYKDRTQWYIFDLSGKPIDGCANKI